MAVQAKDLPLGGSLPGVYKAALFNLGLGLFITVVTAFTFDEFSLGFFAGYMLGFFNLLWLFRIVRQGLAMRPERAMGFVARRYYARFAITAAVIYLLISRGMLSAPWPPLAGIVISVLASIGSLIFIAKEEFK